MQAHSHDAACSLQAWTHSKHIMWFTSHCRKTVIHRVLQLFSSLKSEYACCACFVHPWACDSAQVWRLAGRRHLCWWRAAWENAWATLASKSRCPLTSHAEPASSRHALSSCIASILLSIVVHSFCWAALRPATCILLLGGTWIKRWCSIRSPSWKPLLPVVQPRKVKEHLLRLPDHLAPGDMTDGTPVKLCLCSAGIHRVDIGTASQGGRERAAATGHHDVRGHPRAHPATAGGPQLLWHAACPGHPAQAGEGATILIQTPYCRPIRIPSWAPAPELVCWEQHPGPPIPSIAHSPPAAMPPILSHWSVGSKGLVHRELMAT